MEVHPEIEPPLTSPSHQRKFDEDIFELKPVSKSIATDGDGVGSLADNYASSTRASSLDLDATPRQNEFDNARNNTSNSAPSEGNRILGNGAARQSRVLVLDGDGDEGDERDAYGETAGLGRVQREKPGRGLQAKSGVIIVRGSFSYIRYFPFKPLSGLPISSWD
jgi:hypothetical protein